jgi:hypothetical protein
MKKIAAATGILFLLFSCSMGLKESGGGGSSSRAVTSTLTVSVDFSSTVRGVTHAAIGSLYGVTESVPADIEGLVAPLSPYVFTAPARAGSGYQQPYGAAIPVAGRLQGTSGQVMIRLADICPYWPYSFPGMNSWLNQVSSVISDKRSSGYNNFYGYEIWNEPLYTWNDSNGSFNNLWKRTYDLIRSQDPGAKIIGPSEGYYSSNRMRDFLIFARDNNCLPDIICWHELGSGASTVSASVDDYRSLESSLGISSRPISINEYCDVDHSKEGAPGPSVPFIAKFERKKVDSACISWWWTAHPGRLGSLLASDSTRGGGWWLYHWYGSMTGNMVYVTPPMDASSALDGFASIDSISRYASVVIGGENNGNAVVHLNHIPGWFGSHVRIVIEEASWNNKDSAVYSTQLYSQGIYSVSGGSVSLSLSGLNSLHGYRIVMTPSGSSPTYLNSGSTYKLQNLNSGFVLGVEDEGTADGDNVLQWGDNGTSDHNWVITRINGYYRIKNAHSAKVLGVSGMGTSNGDNVLQWSDNGTADHDWIFTDTGSGLYKIENRNSGKLLVIQDMSSQHGGNAIQWGDNGTADQLWTLIPVQ